MRRIFLLDTWVNDTNLGNRIIMDAIERQMRWVFPGDFVYHATAFERIRVARPAVETADVVLLAGTNMISADMDRTGAWALTLRDAIWLRDVVLMGVGWWQYQAQKANAYTRVLLHRLLSSRWQHSVRDGYTERRMRALGFDAINTGCPTTWELTPEHCAAIPLSRSATALVTLTEYHKNPQRDRRMIEQVLERYDDVLFWPQQYGDLPYLRELTQADLRVLEPSLLALDEALERENLDYVGTRLHAGIRALQQRRRGIIVGVDNRGIEMGADLHLPVIGGEHIERLGDWIDADWPTDVRLPVAAIERWCSQFTAAH
jgi:polysaccharide pyruvyl transferase WcaK-like protein